jgi:hypothetical protein
MLASSQASSAWEHSAWYRAATVDTAYRAATYGDADQWQRFAGSSHEYPSMVDKYLVDYVL